MSWKTVKLGEVCELAYGKSLPKDQRKEFGEIPAYGANGIKTYAISPLYNEPSIIIGRKGSAGELQREDRPFWALDVSFYVKFDSRNVILDYLYYFLTVSDLPSMAKGVKPGINRNEVYELTLPLPPLAEQERIVAKLDAAFAAIDQGIALAEKKEAEVEQLKAALLSASLAGDDWKTVKLGEVCELKNGFAFKSSKFRAEGTPILRISNIQDGSITLKKIVYACQADYTEDLEKYRVSEGALLIAMSGATTGKVGINTTKNSFYLNQRVGMFKPSNALDRDYLYYLLSTKVEENLSISAGAAQPNLSTKQINSITFPLPPLAEQERIVAKLDAAFAELEAVRTAIAESKANYQALKAAILAQELQPKESEAA
jgi:type I restriction enzyme S subunit